MSIEILMYKTHLGWPFIAKKKSKLLLHINQFRPFTSIFIFEISTKVKVPKASVRFSGLLYSNQFSPSESIEEETCQLILYSITKGRSQTKYGPCRLQGGEYNQQQNISAFPRLAMVLWQKWSRDGERQRVSHIYTI